MELKQLVIVLPMSKPVQKLKDILESVAIEENIDISLIDDLKELKQFIGSSGQCLTVFSNAKKCATFLKENKFLITLNHSKVTLFTANEIPGKTLAKLVKFGLTEAILENVAPKTMIYKIKLILRSIKASSKEAENNVVIKNEASVIAPSSMDGSRYKMEAAEADEDDLEEGQGDTKVDQEENVIDYGRNLKAKENAQEEAIDTHWKSDQRKELSILEEVSDVQNIQNKNNEEIDKYYRAEKKKNISDLLIAEGDSTENNEFNEDLEKKLSEEKRKSELEVDLIVQEKIKRKVSLDVVESNLYDGTKNDENIIDSFKKKSLPGIILLSEEEVSRKKKELDELDFLFENAKKKQAMELQIEEESKEDIENVDFDNPELYQRKKSLDIDLLTLDKINKTKMDLGEDGLIANDSHQDQIDSLEIDRVPRDKSSQLVDTFLEKESSNHVNEIMLEVADNNSKKKMEPEVSDQEEKKRKSEQEGFLDIEVSKIRKNIVDIQESLENERNEFDHEKDQNKDEENEKKHSNGVSFEVVTSDSDEKSKQEDEFQEKKKEKERRENVDLKLIDGGKLISKSEFSSSDLTIKEINETNLILEKRKEKKASQEKVDHVDTHYRNDSKSETEHDWDNLNDNKDQRLDFLKKARSKDEIGEARQRKDNGEIIIDYKKIKDEFNHSGKKVGADEGEDNGSEQGMITAQYNPDDTGSFKVVEVDAVGGFLFGVEIINLIYTANSSPNDFFKKISEEIITQYKAYSVFYTFKASTDKHTEEFDSFMHFGDSLVSQSLKEWWLTTKENEDLFIDYFQKSSTTWLCREMANRSEEAKYWEAMELPRWAANELTDKKVEMIFPYIDGVNRMGMALLIFPEGIDSKMEQSIMVTLEVARTIFLELCEKNVGNDVGQSVDEEEVFAVEKNNIFSKIGSFFKRNKAS